MYHLNFKQQQEWEQNGLKIYFFENDQAVMKKNLPTSILYPTIYPPIAKVKLAHYIDFQTSAFSSNNCADCYMMYYFNKKENFNVLSMSSVAISSLKWTTVQKI